MNATIQGQLEGAIRLMETEAEKLLNESETLRKQADAVRVMMNGHAPAAHNGKPKVPKPAKRLSLDATLTKLPKVFTKEQLAKAGGARMAGPMVIHKRIRKLANGTYKKLR